MKNFSKSEIVSIIVIFLVLIVISWPNFALSLRRSRDQVRRDDIGNLQQAITDYYSDYGLYPSSTSDGRIIACKGVAQNEKITLVACNWGHDPWINLTPGVNKVYMKTLPGDPNQSAGVNYDYFSDGSRYQIFASFEGKDEPEVDSKVIARSIECGSRVCNVGRAVNVPLYISIEEYDLQIYCGQHPKDIKCQNKQITK
jgi:type II secretory pathway pseudopilin PulG